MKKETKYLHGYPVIDEYTGAASIPKYQTSTFHKEDISNLKGHIYTRFSNPTVEALNEAIKAITDAQFSFSFSSGMAAISTVLMLFNPGDHIIMPKDIYGGTLKFACEFLTKFNIEYTLVDEEDDESFEKALKPNTKAIYIETPSNPTLKITNIRKVIEVCKANGLISIIDNTFMSSILQPTLDRGIDISIQSASKFLNGHSDVIAGIVATNNEELAAKLCCYQKLLGNMCSVEDAWLLLRGLKTAPLRVYKSCENALIIAKRLNENPNIKMVYYPGLLSHHRHNIHISQCENGGAIISFDVATYENVKKIMDTIKLPICAVSLGGVESILSYPAKMSHACITDEQRADLGVTEGLLRLSVGIENVEDILADLENAINSI